MYYTFIGLIVLAYLIGSIPTSVIIGKYFYDIDVRDYGSGNSGATNTFRILGWKAGLPVLIFDIFKGFLAVFVVDLFDNVYVLSLYQTNGAKLLLGCAVLLGHIFPVYVGFKGGKGIATLLGIMFAILPDPALAATIVFILIFLATKYVSLSSIVAAISFPFIVIFIYKVNMQSLIQFSFVISILVILTHQKNIQRLVNKEESKLRFRKKNQQL